jgi:HlyD family secretion protein
MRFFAKRGWVWMWVGLMGLTACNVFGNANSNNSTRTATLGTGNLLATVTATGNIEPEAVVKLSFQQPGTVAEVNVDVGDAVKKGDVIAKLDTADLDLALAQAQTAVAQAQTAVAHANQQVIVATANYSRTVEGSRPAEIAAAQSALNAATENYNKLKRGPTEEDIAAARAQLQNAEAALKQAQSNYDRAYEHNPAGIGAHPTSLALEQATNNFNASKSSYDKVAQGADEAQLASASQQVQAARAQLDKVRRPAQVFDIEQAKAQIEQAKLQIKTAQSQLQLAEIQVRQAQRRLEQAVIKAPLDGVVGSVFIKVGESVGAGAATQPMITLVDQSQYHIDITVDEIDVAKVARGQAVQITLDSLPGVAVQGQVDRIAPTATTVNGVVSYVVRVIIAKTDAALKAGLTANANIVLAQREGVLLVPNWAIRRDAATGKAFVLLRAGGQTSEVEVRLGLKDDAFTEVLGGVQAGQMVVAPQ